MPSIKYKKKTYAGATFPVLEMTKAEYDALPEAKKMDGTVYMITDDTGGWEAENASYDNTTSGLTAANVQSALDEVVGKLVHFDILTVTMDCTNQAAYDMGGSYSGEKTLTNAEKNNASFLVPLYARQAGQQSGPAISVENGVVRLTNAHSITNVNCGILRIYT